MRPKHSAQKSESRPKQPRRPTVGADQRSAAIASAASRLFLQHGFNGVSLEMIIADAGGSYRDLYNAFGSKEALFETVLRQMCLEILAPLKQALDSTALEKLPLPDVLMRIGQAVLGAVLKPTALAFHRLMVSEAPRVPKIAKLFFQSGPDSANVALGEFLTRLAQKEKFQIEDPNIAAAIFLDGLVNNLQLKALTGHRVSQTEVTLHVKHVVRIFLNGIF